ncbi:unnamed protein product [Hydatigera taeniaeformis]|uniref:PRA1 family protein n=1 Tax=Hydatigena taeniaeformis TaxID=6205 RepID=A0A0R3X2J7_HYDTA|nr:unnamed protein product [Hydatigera taeniaeformis]
MRVPPLRSLNDFLFSYYSVPDMESVNERFTSNMLYYQTNYFLITAILIGINFPVSVLVSSCALVFAIMLCNNLDSWWPFAYRPSRTVIYGIVCTAILLYMLPMMTPTILCLASISLVCIVIMLHALLRQRNMMNKVTRLLDANVPGRYRSPMGLLLGKHGE